MVELATVVAGANRNQQTGEGRQSHPARRRNGYSLLIAQTVLIANRGEIAVRIATTIADLGLVSVAIYPADDADSLHVVRADQALPLPGSGAAAYLDIDAVITAAQATQSDTIHPGYGLLSERVELAVACQEAGLRFVGPSAEILDLVTDKTRARQAAVDAGLSVVAGSTRPVTVDEARSLLQEYGAIMLKATSGGGGGRGLRAVHRLNDLDQAFQRCASEAAASSSTGAVFAERLLERPRHIEVQVVADVHGGVTHLGDRDCSIQRHHQKLVDVAPAPNLPDGLRERLCEAATGLARSVGYQGLGTVEFLLEAEDLDEDSPFHFIEFSPCLTAEHTVTEQLTGLDLVRIQFLVTEGATLADLGLTRPARRIGSAVQLRVAWESGRNEDRKASAETITNFEMPSGRGVRVDGAGYAGYSLDQAGDPLLAKVVISRPAESIQDLVDAAARVAAECRIGGIDTNLPFLRKLLGLPTVRSGALDTDLIARNLYELMAQEEAAPRFPEGGEPAPTSRSTDDRAAVPADQNGQPTPSGSNGVSANGHSNSNGFHIVEQDRMAAPVAVAVAVADNQPGPAQQADVVSTPRAGTLVEVLVEVDQQVRPGQLLAVIESAKLHHELRCEVNGIVRAIEATVGQLLVCEQPLMVIEQSELDSACPPMPVSADGNIDLDHHRPDLAAVLELRRRVGDHARPEARAERQANGYRTTRQNVEELIDPGTFIEYGPLVTAKAPRPYSAEELVDRTPADGLICGIGSINGSMFGPSSRSAVLAFDPTVFAGTIGTKNQAKAERLLQVAERAELPLIVFGEGRGPRPGNDVTLPTSIFGHLGALKGQVPTVGIVNGHCLGTNAALVGGCDLVIATQGANLSVGPLADGEPGAGPDPGLADIQRRVGAVDMVVADEAEAVETAKRYLGYFQGSLEHWIEHDQRRLRPLVPDTRLEAYDMRQAIEILADGESVLEVGHGFDVGIITALVRIEGRPVGVVANDPLRGNGVLGADGCLKAAEFLARCDHFGVPLLFLCDTPGVAGGPEAETTALVRQSSRLILTGAKLTVPSLAIVVRRAGGLGALAMTAASFRRPLATVAWPTAEVTAVAVEETVRLGFGQELAAISNPIARQVRYDELIQQAQLERQAEWLATTFQVDDVIDPAESRRWISALLGGGRGRGGR